MAGFMTPITTNIGWNEPTSKEASETMHCCETTKRAAVISTAAWAEAESVPTGPRGVRDPFHWVQGEAFDAR